MLITVRHLQKRSGVYRYRREVPADLRAAVGRREWLVPLGTDSAIEAAKLAQKLNVQNDALIARLRGGEEPLVKRAERTARKVLKEDDLKQRAIVTAYQLHAAVGGKGSEHAKAVLNAVEHGGTVELEELPLSKAYERDKAKYGGNRDEKRIKFAVDAFIQMVGDRDFLNLKRADVEDWMRKARAKGWSDATVKRRTVALQGIHTRLMIGLDRPLSSAWRKLGLKDSGVDSRLPLNAAHLAAVEAHLSQARLPKHLRWKFVLMKHLGLGAAELGGLRTRDFVFSHRVPHVIVRAHAGRGLKTATRGRSLPLIGEALKIAKEAVAASTSDLVFVPKGRKLNAQTISQSLAREMRAAGIAKSRRLTPYSLRHGFEEALKLANTRDGLIKYAMGHAGSGITDTYGASAPQLTELARAMTRAYRFFGQIDDSIYTPEELVVSPRDGQRTLA